MPIIKVEGQGKMIKTIILNTDQLEKAINRPIDLFLAYFCYKKGAKFTIKNENKTYLSGSYTQNELTEYLKKFIQEYILCVKCQNPETLMRIGNKNDKTKTIKFTCKSCGNKYEINEVRNEKFHKFLISFMEKSLK